MERTDGDDVVPLTHEQLATLLGVGRSYTSRVIQTFKAEGILETRRGSILIVNRDALQMRACLCNEVGQKSFRGSAARGLSHRRDLERAKSAWLRRGAASPLACHITANRIPAKSIRFFMTS